MRYAVAPDGSLTELEGVATTGTRYLSISPTGASCSPPNLSRLGGLHAIGAEGGLSPIGTPLVTGSTGPDLFAVSADSARPYIPEPGTNQILVVAVGPDGAPLQRRLDAGRQLARRG